MEISISGFCLSEHSWKVVASLIAGTWLRSIIGPFTLCSNSIGPIINDCWTKLNLKKEFKLGWHFIYIDHKYSQAISFYLKKVWITIQWVRWLNVTLARMTNLANVWKHKLISTSICICYCYFTNLHNDYSIGFHQIFICSENLFNETLIIEKMYLKTTFYWISFPSIQCLWVEEYSLKLCYAAFW